MPSVHGVCFDNGMSGNCNITCSQFRDGGCDISNEVIEVYTKDELLVDCDDNPVDYIEIHENYDMPLETYTLDDSLEKAKILILQDDCDPLEALHVIIRLRKKGSL